MKSFKRSQRVADQMKRDVAEIIGGMLQHKPGLFVTVTRVEVTDDLQSAKVFYTVLGDESRIQATQRVLDRGVRYIQAELTRRLRLRRMPEVSLRYDAELMEGLRITALIDEVVPKPDVDDEKKS
jgi:ribosome-binding factor A